MPNDQAHDTRTTVAEDRVAAAVSLNVAGVAAPLGGTPIERQFVIDINAVGGTLGGDVQDPSGVQNNKQVFTGDAGGTTYSDEIKFNGQNVLRYSVNQGSTGFGTLGGNIALNNCPGASRLYKGDEIWTRSAMFYPSASWVHNSGRNKFQRHRVYQANNDGSRGYLDTYTDGNQSIGSSILWWIYEGKAQWLSSGDIGPMTFDEWHTIETYMKLDTVSVENGGTARVIMWYDGIRVIDSTVRETLNADTDYLASSAQFLYYGNETAPRALHCYAKDFIVRSSPPPNVDADGFPFIGTI